MRVLTKVENILPSNYRLLRKKRGKPIYIVLTSVLDYENALDLSKAYMTTKMENSYHYLVDYLYTLQLIDTSSQAYHCSCVNMIHQECRDNNSIGIGIIENGDIDKIISNIRDILKNHQNINRDHILTQFQVSSKNGMSIFNTPSIFNRLFEEPKVEIPIDESPKEDSTGMYICTKDLQIYGVIDPSGVPLYPLGVSNKNSKVYVSSLLETNNGVYASIWTSNIARGFVDTQYLSKQMFEEYDMYTLDE